MQHREEQTKLRSISVDVELIKPIARRKYTKNIESQLIPRRTELKIIRLDQQILSSPASANIINLQFAEQNPPLFKRANRKTSRKSQNIIDDRRNGTTQRQLYKNRYHELFKDSMDYFSKNTMQIGPCAKSIMKDTEFNDIYAKRKLINIEKLAYPQRDTKKDAMNRQKYRTLMSRTTRALDITEAADQNLSILGKNNESYRQKDRQSSQRVSRKQSQTRQTQYQVENMLMLKNELKPEYKKQITSLLPIRKPTNKKDYFVFGLGDRPNNSQNKIQIYRDLLWKVNYSNGLYVCTPETVSNNYKFYVGQGNNSNLIRGILKRRFWWTQASHKNQQGINFVWTQLKVNSFFANQEVAVIPEYFIIERIHTQEQRVMSTNSFTEGQFDNNKKIFGRIDYKIWKNHLSKNLKTQKKINESTYQKRIKMYQKKKITKVEDSKPLRMHNHLEQNYYIGNKKALFYNVKRYLQLKGEDPFKVLPLTFHITKGVEDPQYANFLSCYQQIQQEKKTKKNIKNIWIVKPGQNTNRGNGITVCYTLDDIKIRLRGRQRNSDGKLRTFILQKYIENPLLYNRRKFDLRHYILITCINGSFKGYWYQQGYVRTSSSEFNIKASRDPLIHLTNDAIQKNTSQYGKYEKANKLSYAQLQKYFQVIYPTKKYNFYESIIPKMKHFATQAIKATYFILDSKRSKHNFQLLGLDFMIDEEFEPWLIQINTNPCLELCCPHLQRIIPSVIQNTFKICIDPLFPPPQAWPNNRKPFFSDDSIADNKFEIIFDETSDGKQIQKLFNGKDKIDVQMGKIEEDDQTFENDGEVEWQKSE